jgi:hypothetical protein
VGGDAAEAPGVRLREVTAVRIQVVDVLGDVKAAWTTDIDAGLDPDLEPGLLLTYDVVVPVDWTPPLNWRLGMTYAEAEALGLT